MLVTCFFEIILVTSYALSNHPTYVKCKYIKYDIITSAYILIS